jgi:hypothetical protein
MSNIEVLTLGAPTQSALATGRGRRGWKHTFALLAGFVTVVALSVGTDALMHAIGLFPASGAPMSAALFLLALAYRTVYGIAGSYLAAVLAPDRRMAHALVLGAIGLVASAAGAIVACNAGPEFGPLWYPIALVAMALPNAWLGGWLGERRTGV